MDMASGREVTENVRSVYLRTSPDNYRVIKRWEIENYLFDKEVLKKYCTDNGLKFNEIEYDNFVTDIVNQHVKDNFSHIRNFCGIVTNINAEKFKIDLAKHITEDMAVYRELESCIFEKD